MAIVLHGTWVADALRLELRPDGSGVANGIPCRWQQQANVLLLGTADGTLAFWYELAGDRLVVAASGLEPPVALRRAVTASEAPPRGSRPFTPRFSGKTRTLEDPSRKYAITVPESWQLVPGERGNVRFLKAVPPQSGIVRHDLTILSLPVPASRIERDLQGDLEEALVHLDRELATFTRTGVQLLEGPIARIEYRGVHGGQAAVATCGIVQRRFLLLLGIVLSLAENAGEHVDDVLAALASVTVNVEERNATAERALVGQWVIPSQGGTSLEYYEFRPDGTYRYHFESSHSGSIRNSYGETTASWGTASQDGETGRFEVRDDYLYFTHHRGERVALLGFGTDAKGRACVRIDGVTFVR